MRLIDANALIRKAKRRSEVYKLQGLSEAIEDMVQYMTTYAPHPYEMRWIPCAERLPEMHEVVDYTGKYEESDLVLICDASELHPQVHVGLCGKFGDKIWWRTREWKMLDKVTAWMPLPEVYEEKK